MRKTRASWAVCVEGYVRLGTWTCSGRRAPRSRLPQLHISHPRVKRVMPKAYFGTVSVNFPVKRFASVDWQAYEELWKNLNN